MDAPAPWDCRCRALVWITGPPTTGVAGRRPLCTVAGFVSYLETPVGTYDELFAAVAVFHHGLVRGHVPFMPVDSAASVAAGRANWALPKTMARFDGSPLSEVSAAGDGWQVRAAAHAHGPRIPAVALAAIVQRFEDGRLRASGMRFRGRARLATVEVESSAPFVASGRHLGAVFPDARFRLGRPRGASRE